MHVINSRVQYIREVLGVDSILQSSERASVNENTNKVSLEPQKHIDSKPRSISLDLKIDAKKSTSEHRISWLNYQTHNDGPFLFLSNVPEKNNLTPEELQLLEKIIVALKIPFHKTTIAVMALDSKEEAHANLLKASQTYSYIFLMGSELSEILNLHFGEERCINNKTFFSTYDLKKLIENVENKKNAWNQFKNILPKIKSILEG